MGTRADFYIGTGKDAEWLGSIAYDGYRIDDMQEDSCRVSDDAAACWGIKTATTPEAFREAVGNLLACNDDATKPEQGWPWPWETSYLTDYVYAFADGGCRTFTGDEKRVAPWPDMSERKNVTLGPRSGVMLLRV